MPQQAIAGHDTAWRVFGTGPQPALALHCSLAHSGEWAGLAPLLLPQLTLTAPDLPGHGRSAPWDGTVDLHALATAVATGLAAQTGPQDVIGHSFGATVALRLALERPDLVRRLILIEPVLFCAARGTPAFAAYERQHLPFAAALQAGNIEGAAGLFQLIWGSGPLEALPEPQRRYILDRTPLIAAQNPALIEDAGGLLRPFRLEALVRPVLLLEGAASPPVIGAILDALSHRLPDNRRVSVPGAGHMLPLTHPAEVAGAITGFLAEAATA